MPDDTNPIGRMTRSPVSATDGTLLVGEGEVITADVVDRCRAAGRLDELLVAAGAVEEVIAAPGDRSRYTSRTPAPALSSRTFGRSHVRAVAGLGGGTSSPDLTSSAATQLEAQIREALGRPVDRVILDAEDNVILNFGDIITNRAIDLARRAGVLDLVISSVSYQGRMILLTASDLRLPVDR